VSAEAVLTKMRKKGLTVPLGSIQRSPYPLSGGGSTLSLPNPCSPLCGPRSSAHRRSCPCPSKCTVRSITGLDRHSCSTSGPVSTGMGDRK